ncbi:3-methyl-2-oxobutanoate dehydrogenase subunit VorB [candidate division GN15 bacterium]|nr:3-methyl-2-oxobutanoate dehydrogenase subunit VorB [candidate division GN15 bacterium]
MAKILMKGNEAIGEAAIRAGATNYFCYPITPQTEVAEYLARRMPEVGGVFLQAESEVAVGNMLFGAAATGRRVFTTSSSPGISLMQEAISYIAGAQLPCVLLNIMRGGPGLGGILPAQSDYFQATKGGGHGDYRLMVLAPSSIQEAVDLTMDAFPLAEKYRNPVMIIGDGMIGQMMEPVEFPDEVDKGDPATNEGWAATGARDRKPRVIKSLYLDPYKLEENSYVLHEKYEQMKQHEVRYERYKISAKNDLLIVSYGTMARICQTAIDELEQEGVSVGLFRPITLFPYPEKELRKEIEARNVKNVLVVEMSCGQMLEDVERVVQGVKPVTFFGRTGGIVPSPEEAKEQIKNMIKKPTRAKKASKATAKKQAAKKKSSKRQRKDA